ncbi:MAG: ABC transporter permease [Spirochaetaceae bacterium]|nr:ABC transporter permease [Spirochaetaceae bacterium]MCF7948896.1 ABC transporter permease [Spirochaetia bacterium]MCF7951297.1 ABC transporter permease [Spirochaetaceae bacterium]
MRRLQAVLTKELRVYFNTPIAYIAALFFLLFTAGWLYFMQQFYAANVASLRGYFSVFPMVYIFLLPALTMRSWAEETRMKTDEILLTLPIRISELVLGKFLAAFLLISGLLALTIPVPLTLMPMGDFATGQILGQYIGSLLLAGLGIAIGLCISALSANQISAFLFSVVFLLVFTLLWQLTMFVDLPGPLPDLLRYLSLHSHFQSFTKGLVDTRDVSFYLVGIGLFLYFNMKILILRKWR